jgi:ATP-dependent RNA helicase RhlE
MITVAVATGMRFCVPGPQPAKEILNVIVEPFASLGLSSRLLGALADAGYTDPTAIQTQAIPLLLDRRDLLGIAQTGTGKTAAFVLPLLQNLSEDSRHLSERQPRALILAPTRELVLQIAEAIKVYGRRSEARTTVIMGGVGRRPQVVSMRRGVDILVATPGRLLDLISQREVDLSATKYLILDEADRMLDMGFIRDVRKIIRRMPAERQTMLFSATMPGEVATLAGEILNAPERVEIASKSVAVDRISQQVHYLDPVAKRDRLSELLAAPDLERVIVFTRTKHGADKVAKRLARDGFDAEAIHGNKSQGARRKALENFRRGKARVLVATDIASRGIDINDVTHVINYELPNVPEDYVHRIGRTARAGASGTAISFCDSSERPHLRSIERLIKQSLIVIGEAPADTRGSGEKAKKSWRPDNSQNRRRKQHRGNDRRQATVA